VNRSRPDYLNWVEQNPQFREVMQAKFDALSANKIITRLESVKNHTNPNGRCSYEISYYGAVTGRFAAGNEEASGTGSVNMQNFNRDPFYGFAVREIICAEKGKKLLVYDFSQVEAVVLARVSGNKNHLDAVRRKESLYEAEAVGAGVWEKGKPGFKQWTDYIIYKQRVLALGYGLGAMMFQRRMKAYGKILSWKEAEKAVYDYRAQNYMVPQLWRIYDLVLKEAARAEDGELVIYLPSGRELRYFYFSEEEGEIRASQHYTEKRTKKGEGYANPKWYGAKLVENVCQAIARDLLAGGILRVTAAGYRIVAHTHDEVIAEVENSQVEQAMEKIPLLMAVSPSWDPELPVGVSKAEPIDHYRK
jgi:DNA polymerase